MVLIKVLTLEGCCENSYWCKASTHQTLGLFFSIITTIWLILFLGPKELKKGKALSPITYNFTQQCAVWPALTPSPCHTCTQHCLDWILALAGWVPAVCNVGGDVTCITLSHHTYLWLQRSYSQPLSDLLHRIQNYKVSWQVPPKESVTWKAPTHAQHCARYQGDTVGAAGVPNMSMLTSLHIGLHV